MKRKQTADIGSKLGLQIAPEIGKFFAAAEQGDWNSVSNLYTNLRARTGMDQGTARDPAFASQLFQPVLETFGAYEAFVRWDRALLRKFGEDILRSIPDGSIYFGGTDPGRFVITALKEVAGRPKIFVITQNGLADESYRFFLRFVCGNQISVPSDEDAAAAIRLYAEELQRRPAASGERVQVVDGRVNIQGVQAVNAINAIIARQMFERERNNRGFYVEESFALPWMYPHLEPHGIIMKLNRDPLPKLTPEMVAANRKYWADYTAALLTDPRFQGNDTVRRVFSKLRTAHASLYAWRATQGGQPELLSEAEHAFRQAVELCRTSAETTFRYAEFLTKLERFDEATKLVENFGILDKENREVGRVLDQIRKLQQLAGMESTLRRELESNPANLNAAMQMLSVLASRGKFKEMDAGIDQLIQRRDLPAAAFKNFAATYVQLGRWDRIEQVFRQYLGLYPEDAQGWYDLCLVRIQLQQPEAALNSLGQAIRLRPELRQAAYRDARLEKIKLFPSFNQPATESSSATLGKTEPGGAGRASVAGLYDELFGAASVTEAADGSLSIRSAPMRYVMWILAFVVVAPVSWWCWRHRIGGRLAPGFFFASFLIPVLVVPGIALESVRVTPAALTVETGLWFLPTTREIRFSGLESVTEQIETQSGRRSRFGPRHDTVWYFRYRSGEERRMVLSDLFEANRTRVIEYLRRHGVGVRSASGATP
ncbi:MAG: tetratricopeptide repeat protein [Verrucomicrobia bacterium]|nr:tetratricopeptide repeat protein [Verrucomicrobiota bacterium]